MLPQVMYRLNVPHLYTFIVMNISDMHISLRKKKYISNSPTTATECYFISMGEEPAHA